MKSVEERLISGQHMTRLVAQECLKAIHQKAAAEASTTKQQALPSVQQVSDDALYEAAEEFMAVAERQASLICGVFKFYASLVAAGPAGESNAPTLVLTVLDLVRFWQDTSSAGGLGDCNVNISREDLREMVSQIVQARRRIAARKPAGGSKPGAEDDAASVSAPTAVSEKQQQLVIDDLAPFLLRVAYRVLGSSAETQAHVSARSGGGCSIPTSILQALESFHTFVSDVLPLSMACDTVLLKNIMSNDQATRRAVEDSKPMMLAVFQQTCAADSKLAAKNVISQASFVATISDMKGLEEDAGLGTAAASSSKALSIASIQTIFVHAQQLDLNKPMLMCSSEFVSSLVIIALLRIPSPTVRPSAKVARFVSTVLEPYVKRKPEILTRFNAILASSAAAAQQAASSAASMTIAASATSATMATAAATAAAAFGTPSGDEGSAGQTADSLSS